MRATKYIGMDYPTIGSFVALCKDGTEHSDAQMHSPIYWVDEERAKKYVKDLDDTTFWKRECSPHTLKRIEGE